MGVYTVDVAVATSRPPKADRVIRVVVEAPNGDAADLLACQMTMCHPHVVMPVGSVVIDWPTD